MILIIAGRTYNMCVFGCVRGDETDLKSNHENHKTGTF